MRRSIGAPFAILLSVGTAAGDPLTDAIRAQLITIAGTLSVNADTQFADGVLVGCTFTFEALQQDWVYLNGDFIRVSGSFGFMGAEGKTATVVKVTASSITPAVPDLQVRPLSPGRGYLLGDDFSTNYDSLVNSMLSDNGGRFSVFQMSPGAEMITQALYANKLTVAIGLDGASDIQVPVELDVLDVAADGQRHRSSEPVMDFIDCTTTLLGG
jgi:hypothetical protein